MKVILLENLRRIGSIGEIIDVKRGFARNFLISNKKALYASKENIAEVEKIKSELGKKDAEKKKEAQKIAQQINGKEYLIKKLSTENKELYGSVKPTEISKLIQETDKLDIVYDEVGQAYLEKNIDLYLDDALVDTLRIGSGLKGSVVTDIQISGSGVGVDRRSAIADSTNSMKKLQTVLITGSLPVKLEIIKTDTLSPSLGKEFLRNAVLIGILSEIAVTLIVLARYRKIKIALPIITIISSEILLILGLPIIFTFIKQPLDIAAIAGIIVAIGTGVDDQIIITDEILSGESSDKKKYLAWSKRLKKAFFMVIAAYFATIAAMFPLLFAGAELLKGFAVTTIIGVTSGVLITRPAFAVMMRVLLEDEDKK